MKNIACFFILIMSLSSIAHAGIIPSFHPDLSATKATNVIVASEGEKIDGFLDVLDTWKGDLEKGERIWVPELAQFESEEARRIKSWGSEKSFRRVTGKRMIVFLVKSMFLKDSQEESAVDRKPISAIRWLPASYPDFRPVFAGGKEPRNSVARMKISVAWVENGVVYAFRQIMNPGPLVLDNLQTTEEHLKALVLDKSKNCSDFERAAALPDPEERANAILPFTEVDEHRAREKAFNALSECGIPALPHLHQILGDEQLLDRHYLAVKALAKAGGWSAGQEIVSILHSELEYLMGRDDEIKGTAWNNLPSDIRLHILNMQEALKAVKWLRYDDAEDVISDINNWLGNRQRDYGLRSAYRPERAYMNVYGPVTGPAIVDELSLKKKKKIMWGEAISGLQAGMYLAKNTLCVGDVVSPTCYVRNTLARPIVFKILEPCLKSPLILDVTGAKVGVYGGGFSSTPVRFKRYTLRPGESIRLHMKNYVLAPNRPVFKRNKSHGRYNIEIAATSPGKYIVGYEREVWLLKDENQPIHRFNDSEAQQIHLQTGWADLEVLVGDREALSKRVASELRQAAGRFNLKIVRMAEEGSPLRSLWLTVLEPNNRYPEFWSIVQISRREAETIIGHLERTDYLWRTVAEPYDSKAFPIPSYFLSLSIGDESDPKRSFHLGSLPLGWGLEMDRRLKELREMFVSESRKAMDELLAQLEPFREEWRAP